MKRYATLLVAVLVVGILAGSALAGNVDPNLPSYTPTKDKLSGKLISVGSDTIVNMMTLWAEAFQKYYPGIQFEIEGKGSSTAPPALIAGTAQFGPMSRQMKSVETDRFESKFGYKPTQIRIALDALAVYVNKDNPIKGLSLEQVDAIFSKGRLGGYSQAIRTWGQTGLSGTWAARPISLYGRNSASGTYGYFKEHGLFGGDYRNEVKEQPGSAAVVQAITVDRYGIGYSGIGYKTAGVRAVPLAGAEGEAYAEATMDNVLNGSYPLARFLYIYVNQAPGAKLSEAQQEFIKFVFSKEGQQIVEKDGYLPLPAFVVEQELAKLGL